MSRSKQFITYVALIAMSIALWVSLSISGALDGFEQETLRWRYLVRGEVASAAPVVFVNVDPNTVAKMGDKPWDRLNFAQTIHGLLGPGKARAVGVDIIFSPLGAGSLLDVERAKKGDRRFGAVVDVYADRLVLAAAYTNTNQDISALPLRRYGYDDPSLVPFPEAPTFPIVKSDRARFGLANEDVELNKGLVPHKVPAIVETGGEAFALHLANGQLRYLSDSLSDLEVLTEDGYVKVVDSDGFAFESIPVRHSRKLLTIGLEVFLAAHGLSADDIEWREDSLVLRKDGSAFREIPLIEGQSMDVNWLQGWDINRPETHYSMADVLDAANALGEAAIQEDAEAIAKWEQWFERFHGKVIFIGGVDATLKDLAPTPFNQAPAPKVGLHANTYRTVEEEAYLREVDGIQSHVIVIGLTVLVSGLMISSGRRSIFPRAISAVVLVAYVGYAFYVFGSAGYLLPLVAPLGSSMCALLCVVLYKLGSEEFQRRRIKNLFGAYVSPNLVDEMVKSDRDPELGGAEVQVTALFSDVEGFSALSEELSPSELVALMNEYLGAMTQTFQKEQGTLDKYIGDAIVTMFGMPYPVEDHAARACRSAISMQEKHAELRSYWSKEGKWPEKVTQMRTRIGINTGQAVIGNMGSEMRFNYTMMGDSVNLAARCESGAKTYGVYTMITEDTLNSALSFGEKLNYRKLDRIIVKGRILPVDIYELWDGTVDATLAETCKAAYEAALNAYIKGEWEAALAGFEACVAHEPARDYGPTTPSEVLAARCREFIEHGAAEAWDGVYRMTTK